MNILYLAPLSRAWGRMKQILFSPFDIGKWFALGFTAFLAGLVDWGGGQGGGYRKNQSVDWDYFFDLPRQIPLWIAEHQFWVTVIIIGLFFVIALYIILVWLSSRGTFMFLDNVVKNRSLIAQPWREFANHGDSLFLWRLMLGAVSVLMGIEFVLAAYFIARRYYLHGGDVSSNLLLLVTLALVGFVLLVSVLFMELLLKDFIAPIMYKDDVRIIEAWRKFLPLFSAQPMAFILYGLFILGLHILVGIAILIGGLLTCCLGYILLIIPYISSVVLLPVSVTFRALSLEFLEQFGAEFRLFPVPEPPAPQNEPTAPTV